FMRKVSRSRCDDGNGFGRKGKVESLGRFCNRRSAGRPGPLQQETRHAISKFPWVPLCGNALRPREANFRSIFLMTCSGYISGVKMRCEWKFEQNGYAQCASSSDLELRTQGGPALRLRRLRHVGTGAALLSCGRRSPALGCPLSPGPVVV